jgi:hypothetical protein
MTLPQTIFRIDLYGPDGLLDFDAVAASSDDALPAARRSFVDAVRAGRSPALDAHRGLVLQEWIERALASLS